MPNIFELKKQRHFAQTKADKIVTAAEAENRELTEAESNDVDMCLSALKALNPEIAKHERQSTLQQHIINGKLIPAAGNLRQAREPGAPVTFSEEYYNDFYTWIGSRGQQMSAALYEGSSPAGGYTVPVIVDGQIVPLAPTELGVRNIAMVIPTATDIKIPQAASFGQAAIKAESGSTIASFQETDPTLSQFTLSAFMSGAVHTVSWELMQDVPTFQQFAITDLILSTQMLEEGLFVTGTSTGQAQGLLGNVGAGVTGVAAGSDNYAGELLASTFDVLGKLNAMYYPGACWLMHRATGAAIRKAQMASNLFAQVWTRENGQDYLHGFPVAFSGSMPQIAAGNTPVLFGNFKLGYIIGDRGGSGINVKILDQPLATQGQVQLLAYRRMDARVRRSEAIQGITLHT